MVKIYKICDNNGKIIYIGKTKQKCLITRFLQHKNDKTHLEKSEYLQKYYSEIVLIKEVMEEFADYEERRFINAFKPLFNRILKMDITEKRALALQKANEIIKNLNKKK